VTSSILELSSFPFNLAWSEAWYEPDREGSYRHRVEVPPLSNQPAVSQTGKLSEIFGAIETFGPSICADGRQVGLAKVPRIWSCQLCTYLFSMSVLLLFGGGL
jgi:hypothetical protein